MRVLGFFLAPAKCSPCRRGKASQPRAALLNCMHASQGSVMQYLGLTTWDLCLVSCCSGPFCCLLCARGELLLFVVYRYRLDPCGHLQHFLIIAVSSCFEACNALFSYMQVLSPYTGCADPESQPCASVSRAISRRSQRGASKRDLVIEQQ